MIFAMSSGMLGESTALDHAASTTFLDIGGECEEITDEPSEEDNSLVEDVSDNGDDTDNNTVDDPTRTFITFTPEYLEIFNLVTPNGDGLNDFFEIRGVENFPNTFVRIYNRWGVLVFETENYENNAASDRVFKGFS